MALPGFTSHPGSITFWLCGPLRASAWLYYYILSGLMILQCIHSEQTKVCPLNTTKQKDEFTARLSACGLQTQGRESNEFQVAHRPRDCWVVNAEDISIFQLMGCLSGLSPPCLSQIWARDLSAVLSSTWVCYFSSSLDSWRSHRLVTFQQFLLFWYASAQKCLATYRSKFKLHSSWYLRLWTQIYWNNERTSTIWL